MNQEIYRPAGLTGKPQNAYSEGRVIYMPDVTVVDRESAKGTATRGQSSKIDTTRSESANEEMLRRMLTERLAGGEIRKPGFGPKDGARFSEKFRPEYDQKTNANLPDSDRGNVAADVLFTKGLLPGGKLTEAQNKALLRAHYTKNAFEKVGELHKAFDKNQIRTLIEAHLAGMSPPTQGGPSAQDREIEGVMTSADPVETIDPATFTDANIMSIATKIRDLYNADQLDLESLSTFNEAVNKHVGDNPAANAVEAKRLEKAIRKMSQLDNVRMGRSRGRDDYSSEHAKDKDFKDRIAAARAAGNLALEQTLVGERKDYVRGIAKRLNVQSGGYYDDLFKIIIDEGNSLDYLVNKIISPPLDSETGDWSLGFYGQNNLDTIQNLLRTDKENQDLPPDLRASRNVQYQAIGEIEEAARLAQAVNKAIINADLKTFSAIAGSLDSEKLTRLGKIKGVGVIGRLLEGEYGSLIAREKTINNNNYDILLGRTKDPKTGLVEKYQDNSALQTFRELVTNARARLGDPNITPEMRELATLEDWEVTWAFNIGKSLYNMWLRSAEWISQGEVPKGDKGYVSFPQESIARILNWPQWMLQRFDISESRGGMKWLELALEKHQEIREEEGYGHMGLEKIGGRKIENFEMPDMVGVRGWWATWREKQLLMSTMPLKYDPRLSVSNATISREGKIINPGETTDLGILLDSESALTIDVPGVYTGALSKAPIGVRLDFLRSIFYDNNRNIRPDYKRGLGASLFFLKPSSHGEGAHEMNHLKEEIREKLWHLTAEENPLALLPFLEGLKYKEGRTVNIVPGPNAPQADKDAWRVFERKLFQLNEIKMQKIKAFDDQIYSAVAADRAAAITAVEGISLHSVMGEEAARAAGGIILDAREQAWLDQIKTEGEHAAKHLANVRFEYNPFLNDAPLEKVNYNVVGAEGYRRMLNDTGGFSEANDALIKIMDNPSKYKEPEELFEAIAPFISGVGGILGTDVGQRKGYLWLEAALDFYERGNNAPTHEIKIPFTKAKVELKTLQRVERWLRQQTPIHSIYEAIHKANSISQEYAGPEATVWDSQRLFHASHEAFQMGVITEEEEKRWRKRFGGAFKYGLTQLLRALFAGTIVMSADVTKRSFEDLETG